MQDARQRLIEALPFLLLAVSKTQVEAQLRGQKTTTFLGLFYEHEDGSGRIEARLEAEPFFQDLLEVLGFKDFEDFLLKTDVDD